MTTGAAVARDGAWHALPEPDLGTLIRSGPDALRRAVEAAGEPLADPVPSVPLRPGKIVAIGLNYLDHIRETGLARRRPRRLMFAKFPSSVIGDGDAIVDRRGADRARRLGGRARRR